MDVGEVKLNIGMNMIGMVMRSGATIKRTDTLGRYSVEVTRTRKAAAKPAHTERKTLKFAVGIIPIDSH